MAAGSASDCGRVDGGNKKSLKNQQITELPGQGYERNAEHSRGANLPPTCLATTTSQALIRRSFRLAVRATLHRYESKFLLRYRASQTLPQAAIRVLQRKSHAPRARSGLAESRGISKKGRVRFKLQAGLEASVHGARLFFGPAGAGGCGGGLGPVVPRSGQDVHGQRRQRCEVVAAPATISSTTPASASIHHSRKRPKPISTG
jgi:hypothetical protein